MTELTMTAMPLSIALIQIAVPILFVAARRVQKFIATTELTTTATAISIALIQIAIQILRALVQELHAERILTAVAAEFVLALEIPRCVPKFEEEQVPRLA
jgi:hypothetical protein